MTHSMTFYSIFCNFQRFEPVEINRKSALLKKLFQNCVLCRSEDKFHHTGDIAVCFFGYVMYKHTICSQHPVCKREVIKRLTVNQLHGNLTPPRISPSRSHWLRRFYHARPVTEREYL